MTKPLDGVRVMDLTQVFAGPTCTRILSDLGAEVIRMESPNRLDITRSLIHADNDGLEVPWERALYFTIRNAGKKEIVVDLNQERGREILRGIIAQSDVLAESFTPRVMRAFELDYEHVRQIKPDIVMISLSGYGQDGPYSDWSAYGMGLEPASGVSQLTGYLGGAPLRSGLSFTDPYSGFVGAGAVLAALHYRRRTGKGQYIDLSEQEAAVPLIGAALMDYAMNGRLPERIGNRSPWAAPQGCYRCQGDDDWLVISIESDDEWVALCRAAGHDGWAQDQRFASVLGRAAHHDEIDRLIEGWTRDQDHYEAFHLLQRAGVKAAPVLNGKEVLFDRHFHERHHFDVVDQPHIGRRPVQRHLAAKFTSASLSAGDSFEASAQGSAPTFGQHNREVLGGLLGMSDAEIDELEAQGVIASKPNLPVPPQYVSQALKLPYEQYLEIGILRALEANYEAQLGLG